MAQPRTNYHVTPNPRGGWGVKKQGAKQFSRTFDDKSSAVKWAKRQAKKNKPSEVLVHKMNGVIHRRTTYKDDPMPPKG